MICGNPQSAECASDRTMTEIGRFIHFSVENKVCSGDLKTGLLIVDATQANALPKNQVSDFDGDGKTDFSVYTPSSGVWSIEKSSNGTTSATHFGASADKIEAGDFDGDSKSDIAVWRPSDGVWYVLGSTRGFFAAQFGANGDVPVAGDYDADGKTDFAVFRPSNGIVVYPAEHARISRDAIRHLDR